MEEENKRNNDNIIWKLLEQCKYIKWKNVENLEEYNKNSREKGER